MASSKQKTKKEASCHQCHNGRFPTLPAVILAVGIIWLLNDLSLVAIDLPWLPVVLIIVAVGLIMNRYARKA